MTGSRRPWGQGMAPVGGIQTSVIRRASMVLHSHISRHERIAYSSAPPRLRRLRAVPGTPTTPAAGYLERPSHGILYGYADGGSGPHAAVWRALEMFQAIYPTECVLGGGTSYVPEMSTLFKGAAASLGLRLRATGCGGLPDGAEGTSCIGSQPTLWSDFGISRRGEPIACLYVMCVMCTITEYGVQ